MSDTLQVLGLYAGKRASKQNFSSTKMQLRLQSLYQSLELDGSRSTDIMYKSASATFGPSSRCSPALLFARGLAAKQIFKCVGIYTLLDTHTAHSNNGLYGSCFFCFDTSGKALSEKTKLSAM